MQLTVRVFALQRQQLGVRELPLEVGEGATIDDAWAALCATHPVLSAAGQSMRFARNGVYADGGEPLAEGDELALIPPVAGGAAAADDPGTVPDRPVRWIALSAGPIRDADLAELRAAVATDADGAVVTFLGRTRESPGTPAPGQEAEAARFAGQRVIGLDYEAYEAMALATLEVIADEIAARFGVHRLAIVHRVGEVGVGETSVAIAVAAAHRGAAFDACRYAIEELKARAPIWKSERFADGSVWLGAPARSGPAPEPDEPRRQPSGSPGKGTA
ncbi:MAG: molybdenum cofactor biosynthesis protein MoaE [Candidatus Limnocylindrales bacterium]